MRVVLQRSKNSSVSILGKEINKIEYGLVILVGFTNGDSIIDIDYIVNKIINLRIFDDENKVMNKSISDINGEILSISQFTLYADTKKGRRPSYDKALTASLAKELYEVFNQKLKDYGMIVKTGVFGENMCVAINNDGPVTIIIESREMYDQK